MRVYVGCPSGGGYHSGATATTGDCWTLTCASTANFRWSDLRPILELERRRERERKAAAQLREIDELLATVLSPEDRKKAFELWKAALYEQGRCRQS
jgi:hypothetical protein